MARSFKLYIKQGGTWQELRAVFPFNVGELLDERLDEAYSTFFSDEKQYRPLTEFRADFYKDGVPEPDANGNASEYFILANDRSSEYPSGSGHYKHEVYLIERTKLLEGILCPSLTFTNQKVDDGFILSGYSIYGENMTVNIGDGDTPLGVESLLITPLPIVVQADTDYELTDPKGICERLAIWIEQLRPGFEIEAQETIMLRNGEVYRTCAYDSAGTELAFWNDTFIVNFRDTITLRYQCCIRTVNDNTTSVYNLPVVIRARDPAKDLKPWTITDAVNRVLELAEPLRIGENPRYTFDGVTYSEGLAQQYAEGSQAEEYDGVYAPELSMTQSTLREQLHVIGSYIHAEAFLDENDKIKFLKYGKTTPSEQITKDTPYVSHTRSWDINQYCTEIRSNAQNLTSSLSYAKGAFIEPARGLYRSLRTDTLYVRVGEENGVAHTDLPIYEVDEVLCGIAQGEGNISGWATIDGVSFAPKKITPYVFESTIYNANLSSIGGGYPNSKAWAIYYTIGANNLDGLFFREPNAINEATYSPWAIANILAAVNGVSPASVYNALSGDLNRGAQNLVFQITYKPIASAFVSHGKQEYDPTVDTFVQIYNQSDNLVETRYFGSNMKGVAARLGNVEQERTFILHDRAQIPRVGELVDGYAISAVSSEIMPLYIKCTVGLTKDYNRISEYIGINSLKRMYQISERQAQKRDILVHEILLFSGRQREVNDEPFFNDLSGFIGAFDPATSEGDASKRVTSAVFRGHNGPRANTNLPLTVLPCIGRSFGNSVHFVFTMKDNYSAGERSIWGKRSEVVGRWNTDTPYTDDNGRIYWASIFLYNEVIPTAEDAMQKLAFSLPYTDMLLGGQGFTSIPTYRLRKDNREIISYNFEVEYKTDIPDLIIGSELAARCQYVNDNADLQYIAMYATNRDPSKFEDVFIPREEDYTPSYPEALYFNTVDNGNGTGQIDIITPFNSLVYGNYKYWVICTPITSGTREYIDEYGSPVEISETEGGRVLLIGEFEGFVPTGLGYQRSINIFTKRS